MEKLVIYGHGGFAREVADAIRTGIAGPAIEITGFMVDDLFRVDEIQKSNYLKHEMIVAIGDPIIRKNIVDSMPGAIYASINLGNCFDARIGDGTIIQPGVIITSNVVIGKHCQINLNTTIGHDCMIGDYVTIAPGANISGNVIIGNLCYIGTGVCIKEGITICDNTTIGMGGVVVKNITEPGIYIGCPAIKQNKII